MQFSVTVMITNEKKTVWIREKESHERHLISFVRQLAMVSSPLLFVLLALPLFTYQKQYSCQRQTSCGCSKDWKIQSKIVGGEKVRKRSWGWIVSLAYQSNQSHFCAGSILSDSWILTAAHCVADRDPSDIMVNAGSNRLDQIIQQRDIEIIISHPFYDAYTYVNDIALIQLSLPLDMTDPVLAKICLPTQSGKII